MNATNDIKRLFGRGRTPDEAGNVYGRLTVVRLAPRINHRARWVCTCSCGVEIEVYASSLRSGNTKSCGCYHREIAKEQKSKPEGVSAFNRAISVMARNAAKRGIDWLLPLEQVRLLMTMECHYCGAEPSNLAKARNGDFVYSGIDRVDNTKGYVDGNVVPCCATCNTAKSDLSLSDFKAWASRLFNHLQGE